MKKGQLHGSTADPKSNGEQSLNRRINQMTTTIAITSDVARRSERSRCADGKDLIRILYLAELIKRCATNPVKGTARSWFGFINNEKKHHSVLGLGNWKGIVAVYPITRSNQISSI